jgi:Ca2+-binding RTX toxin-like protein
MQRTIWLLASVLVTLMLLSEVAWAANKYCHSGTTCRGTKGRDSIYGTLGSDSISGLRGDDQIYAKAGSDRIRGGGGADWLYGANGPDTIDGGPGFDHCTGNSGPNKFISCESK